MKSANKMIVGLLLTISMAFSISANAQNIVSATLAVNDNGPYAGAFDELLHALTADYVYNDKGAVIRILEFRNGPFTVLAPTDGAFQALKQTLACNGIALSDVPDILRTTLAYHAARGMLMAEDVVATSEITTLAGATILQDGGVLTDVVGQQVNILATDIVVGNGVIHVIDSVLLPADLGLTACGS
jgi:uncharacterized surface protein with fasciclin (FAS1) repeats